jgi:hypothetical protein
LQTNYGKEFFMLSIVIQTIFCREYMVRKIGCVPLSIGNTFNNYYFWSFF